MRNSPNLRKMLIYCLVYMYVHTLFPLCFRMSLIIGKSIKKGSIHFLKSVIHTVIILQKNGNVCPGAILNVGE